MTARPARGALVAILATGALLVGCTSAGETPTPRSSAPITSAARPVPAEEHRSAVPEFTTIDGTWCAVDEPASCVTFALPYLDDGDGGSSLVDPPTVDELGTPCYTSATTNIATGIGEAGLFYCPRGLTPDEAVVADFDDVGFDRVYVTQNPPYVRVYFREEDLDAAMQRLSIAP